jgi:hypothetical protein
MRLLAKNLQFPGLFPEVTKVSGKNGERNPKLGELSAQMRGSGVEHASRATCKTRRKDASTEQPEKPGDAAGFLVKSAMKEDWVKSHPRL